MVVVCDVVLDLPGHIVFAPSREDSFAASAWDAAEAAQPARRRGCFSDDLPGPDKGWTGKSAFGAVVRTIRTTLTSPLPSAAAVGRPQRLSVRGWGSPCPSRFGPHGAARFAPFAGFAPFARSAAPGPPLASGGPCAQLWERPYLTLSVMGCASSPTPPLRGPSFQGYGPFVSAAGSGPKGDHRLLRERARTSSRSGATPTLSSRWSSAPKARP
jgi:hypothetical protein